MLKQRNIEVILVSISAIILIIAEMVLFIHLVSNAAVERYKKTCAPVESTSYLECQK
jgi:hypothetical protein